MVYNPFEVLRKSESMCREIYGIMESNGERPDLAVWFQERTRPDVIVVCTYAFGSSTLKELFAVGYYATFFGNDYGYVEIWFSKD